MFKFSKTKIIYEGFLKKALFFSSFFIPFLFISAIFDLPETAFINSLLVILVVLELKEKANSKALEQIINVLGEIITILGSLFVLLLFINSYLKLSLPLYEFYQSFWGEFETLMNVSIISMTLIVILPILYFGVLARFVEFIIKSSKRKKEISALLFVLLFLIIITASRFFTAEISEMISSFSVTLYQKLPWLFGFSLAFLHLNYLIKKGKELIENKKGPTSIIIALIIFLIGGIFVLRYWQMPRGEALEEVVEPEEVIRNETDGWEVYRNEEYGFEIKYPENWNVARNIMRFEPNLVFCPPNLIDSDPDLGCQLKIGATKPQYENGMIYLFAYGIGQEHTKSLEYHHLGFRGEKDYYLFSPYDVNEAMANQMIPTFKFLE